MITFLTTAKPFAGLAKIQQINALRSWRAVVPDAEIILFGNGADYGRVAEELGLTHIPDVACNDRGMPRVDAMFETASRIGRHAIKAYLNCDIVLTGSVVRAIGRIVFDRFLMVAQRWNVDANASIDFEQPAWEVELLASVKQRGKLFRGDAIDAFFWKGSIWKDLPPMVVGRGKYDNWLIYYCRAQGVPVVDATDEVTLVHQNHDYSLVGGGMKEVMEGTEASRNLSLGGGLAHMFTISDADWQLTRKGLTRRRCRGDSKRFAEVFSVLHPDSALARSSIGRLALEAYCELMERAKKRPADLAKFMPWLFLRCIGRR